MEKISFRDRQIVLNVENRKKQDGEPIEVWFWSLVPCLEKAGLASDRLPRSVKGEPVLSGWRNTRIDAIISAKCAIEEGITEFELTTEHIVLLQKAYVRFFSQPHLGTIAIDNKRPFGDSAILHDIASILNWDQDDSEDEMSPETEASAEIIYRDLALALQIVLANAAFEPGVYRKLGEFDSRSWVKICRNQS